MDLGALSDDELVVRLRRESGQGRDELINELFGRHYERVARWCLRFTNDRDAAADLAQDVFLKAHRHVASFNGTSRFTTWLYAIVRNESLNRLRKAVPAMEAEDGLEEFPAAQERPDELVERQDLAERIGTLLTEALDSDERAVFTLHYGDDMPLDAITRLLRLQNTSGAKAYIVSARRKLARVVQRMRARGQEL